MGVTKHLLTGMILQVLLLMMRKTNPRMKSLRSKPNRKVILNGGYTPQNKHGTWKWTLGKGDSYWKPPFPGSMLIFWGINYSLMIRITQLPPHPENERMSPKKGLFQKEGKPDRLPVPSFFRSGVVRLFQVFQSALFGMVRTWPFQRFN